VNQLKKQRKQKLNSGLEKEILSKDVKERKLKW